MYGVIKKMTNSGVKTPLVQSHDMKPTKMKKVNVIEIALQLKFGIYLALR